MPTFGLQKLDAIKGKQTFYQLTLDNKGQLSCFGDELQDRYKTELLTIYAYMNLLANLQTLPSTKFKDITPSNESVKEVEFKSKHLRVYAIHLKKVGKVVVLGGYKNQQKKDIPKFQSLKEQFLKSL